MFLEKEYPKYSLLSLGTMAIAYDLEKLGHQLEYTCVFKTTVNLSFSMNYRSTEKGIKWYDLSQNVKKSFMEEMRVKKNFEE